MPENVVPDELFDADNHTLAGRSDWIVQDGGLIRAPMVGDFVPESLQAPLRRPTEAPASTTRGTPAMNARTAMETPSRPRAVIVDIDGMAAKHVLPDGTLLRGHHDYSLVVRDLPNPPVIDTVNALWNAGHQIIFCSGRPERDDRGYSVRAATRRWLGRHLGEWADDSLLLMRGQGDRRLTTRSSTSCSTPTFVTPTTSSWPWTTVTEWWPCGAHSASSACRSTRGTSEAATAHPTGPALRPRTARSRSTVSSFSCPARLSEMERSINCRPYRLGENRRIRVDNKLFPDE
ncbi:hypothetical protein [Kitasatospora sp. NPDC092286]|uniref:phosphatase domain-containing protein n=1 Tax=Kitasatospora sp. NPDC092286 TaxID=3364087 RepID=UPI0038232473